MGDVTTARDDATPGSRGKCDANPVNDGYWQQKTPSVEEGVSKRAMGFEAITNPKNPRRKHAVVEFGAVKASVARCQPIPADDDFVHVMKAWPTLPPAIRVGILAMIRAAIGEDR